MSKGKRVSEAERQAVIGRYRASGLSQKEFCAGEGINIHSLQWWINDCKHQAVRVVKVKADAVPRLLPMRVRQAAMGSAVERNSAAIEAAIESGIVVRFSEANDSDYIARLLRKLMGTGSAAC